MSHRVGRSVLVAHSGRQHSHRLAMALQERGLLNTYICGVPTSPATCPPYMRRWWRRADNWDQFLPPSQVICLPIATVVRNLVGRRLGAAIGTSVSHRADAWFDARVAVRLPAQKCDAVVGYENSSNRTFRMAKKLGIQTILDAASVHHHLQDAMMRPRESARSHKRIVQNKDAEIQMADWIITTSDLARDSYVRAGIPSRRVCTIPMGVDLTHFQPPSRGTAHDTADRPMRFVFVGRFEKLKGSEYLYSVMQKFLLEASASTLTLVGDVNERAILGLSNVTHVGRLSHEDLGKTLAEHDVLVLPSRFDSFGMVVVEALAVGLPVIVSQGVGSQMVVREGTNGWIMREDSEQALYDAMRFAVENRESVESMRTAATETAREYQWSGYTDRVSRFFEDVLLCR